MERAPAFCVGLRYVERILELLVGRWRGDNGNVKISFFCPARNQIKVFLLAKVGREYGVGRREDGEYKYLHPAQPFEFLLHARAFRDDIRTSGGSEWCLGRWVCHAVV